MEIKSPNAEKGLGAEEFGEGGTWTRLFPTWWTDLLLVVGLYPLCASDYYVESEAFGFRTRS